jgi:hypothetical protein
VVTKRNAHGKAVERRLPVLIFHDFRRTAVRLERAGVARSVAMELVGHKTEPKSYCIKVTSQMRSPTCVTPTFWPAKTWLRFTFRPLKQIRPHCVTVANPAGRHDRARDDRVRSNARALGSVVEWV